MILRFLENWSFLEVFEIVWRFLEVSLFLGGYLGVFAGI